MPSLSDLQRVWLLKQLGLTSLTGAANTEADLQAALYGAAGGLASNRLMAVGRYYPAGSAQGPATNALTLSQMVLVPFEAGEVFTADRITCEVTVAGTTGNVVRMGIYSSDADGLPSVLLVDAGAVDATIAGGKEIAISTKLNPGINWLAIVAQIGVAPTVRADVANHNPYVSNNALPAGATYSSYVQTAAVAGALPATVGAFTASSLAPKMFLRAA